MKTTVINLYGGPGAGKTTCAWEIAMNLKKSGRLVEYVPEYAKELVWDGNMKKLSDQEHVTGTQQHRIDRLMGKVEYIVTDSPPILGLAYGSVSDSFKQILVEKFLRSHNINLFIQRDIRYYEKQGRCHSLNQALKLDQNIKAILKKLNIPYVKVTHETILSTLNHQTKISVLSSNYGNDNIDWSMK